MGLINVAERVAWNTFPSSLPVATPLEGFAMGEEVQREHPPRLPPHRAMGQAHDDATGAPLAWSPRPARSTFTLTVTSPWSVDRSAAVLAEQLRVLRLARNIRRSAISDLLVLVMLVPLAHAPLWCFAFVS